MILPVPDIMLRDIYELRLENLADMGIKLLLLDLDNTLAPYGQGTATDELIRWIGSVKAAGIEPLIFSNAPEKRVEPYGTQLQADYVYRARKPRPGKITETLRRKGIAPENAAIVGDQVYTDVLGGLRAGILTAAVRPMRMTNPLHFIRYLAEMPFRLACKNKGKV